jgi:phage baseplate assembly protein gpV
MKPFENKDINTENLPGIYFGRVAQDSVSDTDIPGAIKVQVYNIFSDPIKAKDMPTALPLISCTAPDIGDEVCVVFEQSDVLRPRYFPKTFLSGVNTAAIDTLYSAIVKFKQQNAKQNVSAVSKSFSEPKTSSDGKRTSKSFVDIQQEGGDSDSNGVMVERVTEPGKESFSVYHPKGTWVDINPAGDVIVHGASDVFVIALGDLNSYTKGNMVAKVDGAADFKVAGSVTLSSPSVKITGGSVEIAGTAAPTGSGPFCAIPNCIFSGAPHIGKKIVGT